METSKPLTDSVAIGLLKPAGYNPRTISKTEFDSLKRSIKEFGFVEPVIANTNGSIIISGHQRWRAARELGLKNLPVVWVTLDPGKEKALNIAMNKISGEFDNDMLAELILELDTDLLELTGFDDKELVALSADPFDEEPTEEPEKPKVKRYTTNELRTLAKGIYPAEAPAILDFLDVVDRA